MARTTDALVGGVIEVDSSIPLAPFISIANELVTELCVGTLGPSTAYTATRLQLIETWLAAHFYAVRDPRATLESAGKVSQTLQSKVDLGLDVTHYGQMAKRLDTNGQLSALDESSKKGARSALGVTWLGTEVT